ncbi:MAG TPA: hypothetical protein VJT70_06640 [Sphingomicrobium sp.]|nr:hypothetical protein [Sphingomicrobium sp.]
MRKLAFVLSLYALSSCAKADAPHISLRQLQLDQIEVSCGLKPGAVRMVDQVRVTVVGEVKEAAFNCLLTALQKPEPPFQLGFFGKESLQEKRP